MMGRRVIAAALVSATALIMTGCGMQTEDMGFLWQSPYYPKLKLEVDTPEGTKSGYSIIEVKWDKAGRGFNVRGEAVAVDLPNGETLFMLLRSETSVDWAAYLHQIVKLDNASEDQALYYQQIASNRTIWTIPRTKEGFAQGEVFDNFPYFVRFRDIQDPKSVEQVDPDDFAKSFGQGYRFKSLTMQMTDEIVTSGIERRLAWLKKMDEYSFQKDGPFDASYPPIVQYLRIN